MYVYVYYVYVYYVPRSHNVYLSLFVALVSLFVRFSYVNIYISKLKYSQISKNAKIKNMCRQAGSNPPP